MRRQHFANTANVKYLYRDYEDHSLFLLTLALYPSSLADATAASGALGRALGLHFRRDE